MKYLLVIWVLASGHTAAVVEVPVTSLAACRVIAARAVAGYVASAANAPQKASVKTACERAKR